MIFAHLYLILPGMLEVDFFDKYFLDKFFNHEEFSPFCPTHIIFWIWTWGALKSNIQNKYCSKFTSLATLKDAPMISKTVIFWACVTKTSCRDIYSGSGGLIHSATSACLWCNLQTTDNTGGNTESQFRLKHRRTQLWWCDSGRWTCRDVILDVTPGHQV